MPDDKLLVFYSWELKVAAIENARTRCSMELLFSKVWFFRKQSWTSRERCSTRIFRWPNLRPAQITFLNNVLLNSKWLMNWMLASLIYRRISHLEIFEWNLYIFVHFLVCRGTKWPLKIHLKKPLSTLVYIIYQGLVFSKESINYNIHYFLITICLPVFFSQFFVAVTK